MYENLEVDSTLQSNKKYQGILKIPTFLAGVTIASITSGAAEIILTNQNGE